MVRIEILVESVGFDVFTHRCGWVIASRGWSWGGMGRVGDTESDTMREGTLDLARVWEG